MRLAESIYKMQRACGRIRPCRILNIYHPEGGRAKGRALVSYQPLPLWGDPACFRGHSNVWESAEIVRALNMLGYAVDLIGWDDERFQPCHHYDVVFDIHRNLVRCSGADTRTIFHVTGSNPEFSNRAEEARLSAVTERRGVKLAPRRTIGTRDLQVFAENMARADLVTLIGNEVTASTFNPDVRQKARLVIATGAWLPPETEHAPLPAGRREFLWFNGAGAVHKGLDLVLEVFARHPELTLHVVGPYLKEQDFVAAYGRELFRTPTILSHGFLYPGDRRFLEIVSRAAAFVSPSCSEGISTSAVTCMQAGMVPIISGNCGIALPDGSGITLQECSMEEVEAAVLRIAGSDVSEVQAMSSAARCFAWESYSRKAFSRLMTEAIVSVVPS